MTESAIIARVLACALDVPASAWNALLSAQTHPTPFMRHEYLAALESSGSATDTTGWRPRFMTLWQGDDLIAACPLYVKSHSYGEYVFDWAWARAYQEHGLRYYPKAVIGVPFTPVPGSRLLARDDASRSMLMQAVRQWCEDEGLSSAHLLFATPNDLQACAAPEWMVRQTVQFHWRNAAPALPPAGAAPSTPSTQTVSSSTAQWRDFEHFLASFSQDKRKKIRQERRRVADAGVRFKHLQGQAITTADWDFFYRCYERTYLEHGNPPYLSRDFFAGMALDMPENWVMFIALRQEQPIACSLVAVTGSEQSPAAERIAYGRYWGALERVDCLHFEACYYQPIAWCIAQGFARFEGGAQGEHKMARALLPVTTYSAHWLAHPAFAEAVERFLDQEGQGVEAYLEHLQDRSPFRSA